MSKARSFARAFCAVPLAVLVAGVFAAGGGADGTFTNPKHFFWAPGQDVAGSVADSAGNDLIWHGGNVGEGAIGVETSPAVYLVWWGPQWATGFQTADTDGTLYSSKTLQSYLSSFFANVG